MGPCATHGHDGMTTTSPFRFFSSGSSASCRIACLALFIGTPLFTQAAALNLGITDAAGQPLLDAIALREPASGKAAVKPMADLEISQAKRQFSPRVMLITAGTPLRFNKPAVAMLGCNIHDRMAAWVVVADTPWFAGERVLQSLLDQNAQKLSEGARLREADDGFRSAVQSNDAETIASVLGHHGARSGATEAALLANDFTWRADGGAGAGRLGVDGRAARHEAGTRDEEPVGTRRHAARAGSRRCTPGLWH